MNGSRWNLLRRGAIAALRTSAAWLLLLGICPAQADADNLGLAALTDKALHPRSGELMAFTVAENLQNSTDLNGDGDALDDRIVHVFDGCRTFNLGLATRNRIDDRFVEGNLLAFSVSEVLQGMQDLNGDGDNTDADVAFLFDGATGTTTNLGLASFWLSPPRISNGLLAFSVSESLQGMLDLNGDGDALDGHVVHVLDAATGSITNLRLACRNFGESALDQDLLAFSVSELEQGTDLNGDGDTGDAHVLHVLDRATGQVRNSRLASNDFRVALGGRRAFFAASEVQHGGDLNGDGDQQDAYVMHVLDESTGVITNLRLATERFDRLLNGDIFVFPVSEILQGQDLNGDGDAIDSRVLHVFNAATGTTTNLRLASTTFDVELSGDMVAFTVSESLQGGSDLNGDGDAQDGHVAHVFRLAGSLTTNLRRAIGGGNPNSIKFVLQDDMLAFAVSEDLQGQGDLNGDADLSDGEVVHVFSSSTGVVVNLRLAAFDFAPQLRDGRLLFTVSEDEEGHTDLNSDGDALDGQILHFYDSTSGNTTNLRLNLDRRPEWKVIFDLLFDGELAAFAVPEAQQGTDLNGDGDLNDTVEHLFEVSGLRTTNIGLASLAPSSGSLTAVRKIVGDLVFCKGHEPSQGNADLNGDGDVGDASVAHLYNSRTGKTSNLGLESVDFTFITPDLTWITHGTTEPIPAPDWVSFTTSEISQVADLNGDGDMNDAHVVHIVRVRPLALDADPEHVQSGDLMNLSTCGGTPGSPVLLFLMAIDGLPVNPQFLAAGAFGPMGDWTLGAVIPPGLSGTEITVQTVGKVATKTVWANPETIVFL